MPAYQSQTQAYMAYKIQSGLGSRASGSGGTIFRQTGGAGGRMTKAAIESAEVRRDGMSTRGRHGSKKTTGQWTGEASMGSCEPILEAVLRDTWDASALALTQADFTSLTTGAHTIILASGDPRTLGLRVGDVIRPTDLPDAANNSRNLRITGLSATTITVAETLTVNASGDTSCTLTRPKKLTQFSAGSLIKRYFTIDEYEIDIDQSEVLSDFMWGSVKFTMQPNGLLMLDLSGVGTGAFDVLDTGDAPLLTTPGESSAIPLSVVDAVIRVGGNDVADLTSFDLTMDISPSTPDVIGSLVAPDVFPGDMAVSMNIGCLRKDLQFVSDFADETVYSLSILAVENEAEPKDFISIHVPNLTLGGVNKSALSRSGGARTQTISVPAALVGKDMSGAGFDATMVKFQSTGV